MVVTTKRLGELLESIVRSEAECRDLGWRLSQVRGELQQMLGYAGPVPLERSIELAEALDPTTGEPNDVE